MTERDALLAAIHAAPEDDAPRLVYADWLEEHGEVERAEFIRIQIEMRREYDAHGRIAPARRPVPQTEGSVPAPVGGRAAAVSAPTGVSTYARGFALRDSTCRPPTSARGGGAGRLVRAGDPGSP